HGPRLQHRLVHRHAARRARHALGQRLPRSADPQARGGRSGCMNFSLWPWPYGRWGGVEAVGGGPRRAAAVRLSGVSRSEHTIVTTGPESDGLGWEWPDWSVLSTYLALRTSTFRILSCVVIPYRPVFPMAKQIATVDVVSNGRFTLAAACGWLRPEFGMLRVAPPP